MNLPSVTIINGQGGLQRPPAGSDFISGIIAYMSTLPSGFDSNNRTKKVNSLAQAVALGINFNFSEYNAALALKLTGTVQVTAVGSNGNTVTVTHTNVKGEVVILGTYTKVSGDTTTTQVATAIRNAINARTNITGYTATASTSTVTIVAPAFNGIFAGNLATSIVGAIATTVTGFSGGTISPIAALYYHVSEFFRAMPNGELYIHIPASTYGGTFSEITTLVNFAQGKIRQIGIMNDLQTAFATSQISAIQARCEDAFTANRPIVSVFAPEISATSDLANLVDLSGLDCEMVGVTIGQDGGTTGVGAWLYKSLGKSLSDLGAKLGTLAKSKVSDSWSWVGAYNMTNGLELNDIAFSNGTTYDAAYTAGILEQLVTYGYSFLFKIVDTVGTYNTQPNTCTLESSDYRFLYLNRAIQKAGRLERIGMIPYQSSPTILSADGTMTDVTIETFRSAVEQQLDSMVRASEISAYQVLIDPLQLILQTNAVEIAVNILPVGVADYITIKNTFTLSIA